MIAALLLVAAAPAAPDDCSVAVAIMRDVVLPELPKTRARRSRLEFSHNSIPPGVDLLPNVATIRPTGEDERSRWESTSHENMVAECPKVRALLKQERIRSHLPAARPAWRIHSRLSWGDATYLVSMPQVSADGTEAIFQRSVSGPGRFSLGEIYKVRRAIGGNWTVVEKILLWVS